jgi:serine/threonine protein kinase
VVHRDVKPANILMAPDRAVLTDFGIARAAGTSELTTVGVLIGSPSYMAPEHARGGQSGPAGDLWGLGASLYAAVEGRAPFDRDGGALASLIAVVADELEPATHAGPLWAVISGLLRKDPDERLDAAEAERMLRGVGTTPAASVSPVTPRPRRSRGPALALAGWSALAVIAASGTAVPAVTSTPAPVARAHPPAASTRPPTPARTGLTASAPQARAPRSSSPAATPSSGARNVRRGAPQGWLAVRTAGRFTFCLPARPRHSHAARRPAR